MARRLHMQPRDVNDAKIVGWPSSGATYRFDQLRFFEYPPRLGVYLVLTLIPNIGFLSNKKAPVNDTILTGRYNEARHTFAIVS